MQLSKPKWHATTELMLQPRRSHTLVRTLAISSYPSHTIMSPQCRHSNTRPLWSLRMCAISMLVNDRKRYFANLSSHECAIVIHVKVTSAWWWWLCGATSVYACCYACLLQAVTWILNINVLFLSIVMLCDNCGYNNDSCRELHSWRCTRSGVGVVIWNRQFK